MAITVWNSGQYVIVERDIPRENGLSGQLMNDKFQVWRNDVHIASALRRHAVRDIVEDMVQAAKNTFESTLAVAVIASKDPLELTPVQIHIRGRGDYYWEGRINEEVYDIFAHISHRRSSWRGDKDLEFKTSPMPEPPSTLPSNPLAEVVEATLKSALTKGLTSTELRDIVERVIAEQKAPSQPDNGKTL